MSYDLYVEVCNQPIEVSPYLLFCFLDADADADIYSIVDLSFMIKVHHHHQFFNVPTAGAQVFLMDYT
jgi:hypothetical protein